MFIVGGVTARGSKHVKEKLDNQDAIKYFADENMAVLAVADGHSSSQNFRSSIGAKIAVDVATRILSEYLLNPNQPKKLKFLSTLTDKHHNSTDTIVETLKETIIKEWREEVIKHIKENPIVINRYQNHHSDGLSLVDDTPNVEISVQTPHNEFSPTRKISGDNFKKIQKDLILAYGSTLMLVGVSQKGIFYFQIGDGDIKSTFEEVLSPIPDNPEQIANYTFSLCNENALEQMVGKFFPDFPDIVVVTTDGVGTPLEKEDFLDAFGKDILEIDPPHINETLQKVVDETALRGTDDSTLGYILINKQKEAKKIDTEHSMELNKNSEKKGEKPEIK